MDVLSLSNPAVQSYIVYAAILALKLLALSPMTGVMRVARGVFANPEDAKTMKGKVRFDDPIIERIRRAHRNDLENIPSFWVIGILYLTTGPITLWATLLFRAFTAARIVHTIVYAIIPMPQPTRALAYGVGMIINSYMSLQVVLYYFTAL